MYYQDEKGYLDLLKDTLANGEIKETRNGNVVSVFGCMCNFKDISSAFPLITTKKMFFRGIVEELLWFLRGSTNANELKQKGVHIWNGNSTRKYLDSIGLDYPEGELGPIYGWQWRKFGKRYTGDEHEEDIYNDMDTQDTDSGDSGDTGDSGDSGDSRYISDYNLSNTHCSDTEVISTGIDQIKYILEELLKGTNSRRAVLSAWNPTDLKKMALPPCHILYIFNKGSKGLSCHLTLRSSDLFLGLPFNIASTALLTQILAHTLHIPANEVSLSLCDAHIYKEHIPQVNRQVNSDLYDFPKVIIKKDAPDISVSLDEKIRWIESLTFEDFELSNYKSGVSLQAVMK
jgi:thymidylate synthase